MNPRNEAIPVATCSCPCMSPCFFWVVIVVNIWLSVTCGWYKWTKYVASENLRPLGIRENILRGNERGRELWFGRSGRVARAWSKQDNCGNWLQSSQWAKVHALGPVLSIIHLVVLSIARVWMRSLSAETASWSWGWYSIYYSFSFCSVDICFADMHAPLTCTHAGLCAWLTLADFHHLATTPSSYNN